jgi:hypothetical protein
VVDETFDEYRMFLGHVVELCEHVCSQ